MLEVFPVALLLGGRRCVLVGDGPELQHRAELLAGTGADLLLVPGHAFRDQDLDGAWLCVIAGADAELSARVARAAEARQVFCCTVDRPQHSSFMHMALVRADPLIVGISTAGHAPGLARRLREELSRVFTASSFARWVAALAELRRRAEPGRRREALATALAGLRLTGGLELPELADYSKDGESGGPGLGSGGG